MPLAIPPRNYGREMQPILQYTRSLHMCGLCPRVEWQCCNIEGTDLAALAHLEATVTLRSPYTSVFFSLKINFRSKHLCMCIFFCTFVRFLQSKRKMIKHDGIIIALNEDGTALVRIVQTSACVACKAKAMCASAETAEKEMRVTLLNQEPRIKNQDISATTNQTKVTNPDSMFLAPDSTIKVGDEVEVMVQEKMGWKAVVLAYMLPFFVMLAVIFVGNGLLAMGDGATGLLGDEAKREAVLGTIALCAMAVYYLVLGMFKDRLQKKFSFTARKKNN